MEFIQIIRSKKIKWVSLYQWIERSPTLKNKISLIIRECTEGFLLFTIGHDYCYHFRPYSSTSSNGLLLTALFSFGHHYYPFHLFLIVPLTMNFSQFVPLVCFLPQLIGVVIGTKSLCEGERLVFLGSTRFSSYWSSLHCFVGRQLKTR